MKTARINVRFAGSLLAVSAGVLTAGWPHGPSMAATGKPASAAAINSVGYRRPWQDRFPNVVLQTQDGRRVRFYDDLIKGKIVVIHFMYTACNGT